jgi:diguanylate cyclase
MPRLNPNSGFLGGRLARRLFALFMVAALVPLALSDWLSSTAVTAIANDLNLQSRAETTRQTSRHVLDRLLAGKAVLATTLASAPAPDADSARVPAPRLDRMFSGLAAVPAGGSTAIPTDPSMELVRTWFDAGKGEGEHHPWPRVDAGADVEIRLRIAASPTGPPRLLMGASRAGTLRWVGELKPEYVWAPIADAGDDSEWQVLDSRGRTLTRFVGLDVPAARADNTSAESSTPWDESRSRLFLGAEFAASEWVFVQRSPQPSVQWQGQRLAVWLGLLAAGTLLATTLLSHWQIRRTLAPLELLTEGTRRLSAGASDTRVAVHGDDELGSLGAAFNDMATRIASQFNAIEGLADIDRTILSGAPFDALASRVLLRLSELYPGAGATVSWRSGDESLDQAVLQHAHGKPFVTTVARTHLTPEQSSAYQQLGDEDQTQSRGGHAHDPTERMPWVLGARPPDTTAWALLPIRQHTRTQALLVLGLPAPLPPEQLQPARELRDRLAVALAVRAREDDLIHQAMHDSLTGLINRHGLHVSCDKLLSESGGSGRAALIFLDLDHFKDLNDSRGHEAGDELLCLASARLRECIPANALLVRQGGDEFAIVLPGADATCARAVAAGAIKILSQPFVLREGDYVLSASVGIALSPDHGRTRQTLLRCADIALYEAKASGRGQYTIFSDALDAIASKRVQLQSDLRRALDRSEFVVHFQPRVRPSDGVVSSAEALIRWQHPDRGLVGPGEFIEMAETSGLIEGIGCWIIEATCIQIAAWRKQGIQLGRVSVNVSPRQLASGELLSQVRASLQRHAVPADALELEITESLLVGDVGQARSQLAELRRWGVSIALDDFGTGFSSLSTLRHLPVDVMKIDRSFVAELGSDSGAMAVTRTIVTLARALNLHLVAEGVETEAQATVLRSLGCDEFQGFLYARALPPEDFTLLPGLRRIAGTA